MKKILLLILLVVTSCANQSQKVKIGFNAEYPPYEYIEGDQYVGFNVEVVTKAMELANIEFELINMGFDGLLPALQSKKVDLIFGVSPTPDRRKMVDYTISYTFSEDSAQALLVHKDFEGIITADNLSSKTIGVLLGSFQETIIQSIEGTALKSYNSLTGALLDLNNKKIDAILVSQNPAKEYLSQNPNLVVGGYIEENFSEGYAIAFNKGQDTLKTKLDVAIQQLLDDGTVDELADKYKIYE